MTMLTLDEELRAAEWDTLQRILTVLGQILERLAFPLIEIPAAVAPIVEVPPFEIPAPVVTVTSPNVDVAPITDALQRVMNEQLSRLPEALTALKETLRTSPSGGGVVDHALRNAALDHKRGITDFESRLDYGARTDNQPEYIGRNASGTPTADATWVIEKVTYDGTDRPVRKQVATGAWDNRASLF